jgi:hypothetical protein
MQSADAGTRRLACNVPFAAPDEKYYIHADGERIAFRVFAVR